MKKLIALFLLNLLVITGCQANKVDKGLGVSIESFKESYCELGFSFIKISENKLIGSSSKKDIELELFGKQNVDKVILTVKGSPKIESSGDAISIKLFYYNLSGNSDELFNKTTGFLRLSDHFSSLKMQLNERKIKYKLLHRSWKVGKNRRKYLKIVALKR